MTEFQTKFRSLLEETDSSTEALHTDGPKFSGKEAASENKMQTVKKILKVVVPIVTVALALALIKQKASLFAMKFSRKCGNKESTRSKKAHFANEVEVFSEPDPDPNLDFVDAPSDQTGPVDAHDDPLFQHI